MAFALMCSVASLLLLLLLPPLRIPVHAIEAVIDGDLLQGRDVAQRAHALDAAVQRVVKHVVASVRAAAVVCFVSERGAVPEQNVTKL